VTKPAVLFANEAAQALTHGFNQIARLLALTLGPTQGNILNEKEKGEIESLIDSATVARRVLELPHRATDVGAMLMRNIAWRVHRRAGDGVATTAVLAESILSQAFQYVQAGGNAMLIKQGLNQATQVALAELLDRARPVSDEEELTAVAQTITGEPAMSLVLGEMFDVLGPEAHITVEDYVAPYLERVYYGGGRWKTRLESPYFITDQAGRRAVQNNCRVALFAGPVDSAQDVQHLLELLAQQKQQNLLLITHELSKEALSMLVVNHQREKFNLIAVTNRRPPGRRAEDFEDLAVMTGATVISEKMGQSLANITAQDLGHVRRAEATTDSLIISGGGGPQAARRHYIEHLQTRLSRLPETDKERDELRLRLARLSGGVGVLKVGAHTKPERSALHQKAEKAIRSLRQAMAQGVVPGGGIAYLQLIPAVQQFAASLEGDTRYGADILARALEAPFRQIVQNRGVISPSVALAKLGQFDENHAYDALADQIRPCSEAGLFDPAGVLRIALETAVSGAMLTLTTGVIVLHRNPQKSMEP